MNKNIPLEISISPYNSLSKSSVYYIGLIILSILIVFSLVSLNVGAWPVTVFMGIEYLGIIFLISYFYKKRKIREYIRIDDDKILYKFYKEKNLVKDICFSTHWSKLNFWKKDNRSKLMLSESDRKLEIGISIHTKSKEKLYFKIKKYLS